MADDTTYTPHSIRTYTGKVFDLEIMDPESICIEDIAHALSNTARFGGHTEKLYSVAQHSAIMTFYLEPELHLAALLHDASEAYLGDMPSPFKKLLPAYRMYEDRLMHVIAEKFGFQYPLDPLIKLADVDMLEKEWSSFITKDSKVFSYMTPEEAERLFLTCYKAITKQK